MTVTMRLIGGLSAIVVIGATALTLLPDRPRPTPHGISGDIEAIRRIEAMREQVDGLAEAVARSHGIVSKTRLQTRFTGPLSP